MAQGNGLILPPNMKRPAKERGTDLASKDWVLNRILEVQAQAWGELAATVNEIMERQKALEDHLGFAYVPKPQVPATPPSGGDVE